MPVDLDDFAKNVEVRAREYERQDRLMGLRRKEWVFLGILLALVLLAGANFKRVIVSGHSMDPTFHDGQMLIVWKTVPFSNLKVGDVIVLQDRDGIEIIKRIAFIQNAEETRPWPKTVQYPDGPHPSDDLFRKDLIPDPPTMNVVYVLGDNAAVSMDSRDFGPVAPSQILGKVLFQ